MRALCGRVIATEGADFESAIADLQTALRQRFEELSNLTVATILSMPKPKPLFNDKKDGSHS